MTTLRSRRDLLKLSLAAAGLSVVGQFPRLSLAAEEADAYGGLKMGLQSYSLRDRSYDKFLEAMQSDLHLKYFELFSKHTPGMSPPQVLQKAEAAGTIMASYGVVPFKKGKAKENKALFDLAKAYKIKMLSIDPDAEVLEEIDKMAADYDIKLGIHPHGPAHKWGKVEQLKQAFAGRSTRLGLTADTGHLIRAGENPIKVIEMFKDRVHALHLKDFKRNEQVKDVAAKDAWEDVPAGTANLDVDGLVKLLLGMKFQGPIFIEYEAGDPVESIKQSLARVKEAVKKARA